MKHFSLPLLSVLMLSTLAGCSQQLHNLREDRLANGEQAVEFAVRDTVAAVNIQLDDSGHIDSASRDAVNQLLQQQGALKNQTLMLIPASAGQIVMAEFIAQRLITNGALANQVKIMAASPDIAPEADLQLISRALVVAAPDCRNNSTTWTVNPYQAFDNLGCANRANLATMISNPADLARPQVLDNADGSKAAAAIERYRDNDLPDLIDIDFGD